MQIGGFYSNCNILALCISKLRFVLDIREIEFLYMQLINAFPQGT